MIGWFILVFNGIDKVHSDITEHDPQWGVVRPVCVLCYCRVHFILFRLETDHELANVYIISTRQKCQKDILFCQINIR